MKFYARAAPICIQNFIENLIIEIFQKSSFFLFESGSLRKFGFPKISATSPSVIGIPRNLGSYRNLGT